MATLGKICSEESSSKSYMKCLVWSWLALQGWVCLYHQSLGAVPGCNLGCSGSQSPAHKSRDQQTHGAMAEAWLELFTAVVSLSAPNIPQRPQTSLSVPKLLCTSAPDSGSAPHHRLIPLHIWGELLQLLMWLLWPRSAQSSHWTSSSPPQGLNTLTLLSLVHSL